MSFPYNLHIHSHKSRCARDNMTLDAILTKASSVGFELIGISDHIHFKSDSTDFLFETRTELEKLKTKFALPVLLGCETTQLSPTEISLSNEVASQLDYVIVSSNHYHISQVERPVKNTLEAYIDHQLEMIEGAISYEFTNIIAHPFYLRLNPDSIEYQEYEAKFDLKKLKTVLKLAAHKKVAFEVNPVYFMLYTRLYPAFIQMAQELGVKLAPGTDAHKLEIIDFKHRYPDESMPGIHNLGLNSDDLYWPEF